MSRVNRDYRSPFFLFFIYFPAVSSLRRKKKHLKKKKLLQQSTLEQFRAKVHSGSFFFTTVFLGDYLDFSVFLFYSPGISSSKFIFCVCYLVCRISGLVFCPCTEGLKCRSFLSLLGFVQCFLKQFLSTPCFALFGVYCRTCIALRQFYEIFEGRQLVFLLVVQTALSSVNLVGAFLGLRQFIER